ncbi:MAG: hypothetical protein ACP5O2_07580 [Bacteroidales bacterium]
MKTTSITLTEQELNDLKEFYTMQLARAKREVAHYESILSKLEKKEPLAEKVTIEEPALVTEPAKKRGRPRKVGTVEPEAKPTPEAVEEKPKEEKGKRSKVAGAQEIPAIEKPKGKRGRKPKAPAEAPVAELAETPAIEKPKGKRGRPAKAEGQPTVKAKKTKAKPKAKSKAAKSNTRGRKSVIPTVEIPYTDFIKEVLADAPEAIEAKELITQMKEKYQLNDKAILKKAEMSLRSCLSGLLRNKKIASFKGTSGNMKYYLIKPELEQEIVPENNTPALTE